jgi:YggT family protein
VSIIFALLYLVLMLFQVALVVRIVFEVVQTYARQWRPRGAALVAASAIYAVTDPILRVARRLIPPLRIGGMALDLGFLVLFIVISIAKALVSSVGHSVAVALA